ncbi:hypothetical protein GLE_4720 [Lysobacter enzymogenes]|uniref:Uncharacterized protein n=1 Tax=Lysobacter enzymogenes TaxID=69 RepID=A0A0S2DNU7_LYSEN|nr:hypothetical protein GLE_4720 [Lysobacter enzymogenes]
MSAAATAPGPGGASFGSRRFAFWVAHPYLRRHSGENHHPF